MIEWSKLKEAGGVEKAEEDLFKISKGVSSVRNSWHLSKTPMLRREEECSFEMGEGGLLSSLLFLN